MAASRATICVLEHARLKDDSLISGSSISEYDSLKYGALLTERAKTGLRIKMSIPESKKILFATFTFVMLLAISIGSTNVYAVQSLSNSGSSLLSSHLTDNLSFAPAGKSKMKQLLGVWAGFTINSSEYSIQNVSGSWKVPSVTCNSSSSQPQFEASLVWIDGFYDASYISSGTIAYCPLGGSTPYYFADYQVYPSSSFVEVGCIVPGFSCISKYGIGAVEADDIMYVSIAVNNTNTGCYSQGCNYIVHVEDVNNSGTGGNYTATIPQTIGRFCEEPFPLRITCFTPDSSASWVVDTVVVSGVYEPLAQFTTASFGMQYTKIAETNGADSSGSFYTIGKLPGSLYNDTMILLGYPTGGGSPQNIVMASPSALSTNSSSFSAKWNQAGP